MYNFICTHCGKSFQHETSEIEECPFCFWASSVKRADGLSLKEKKDFAKKKSEIDWERMGEEMMRLFGIVAVVFLISFAPGYFKNVLYGEKTTNQFVKEVYAPGVKQIPSKIEKIGKDFQKVLDRVFNRAPSEYTMKEPKAGNQNLKSDPLGYSPELVACLNEVNSQDPLGVFEETETQKQQRQKCLDEARDMKRGSYEN
jgi:hypothetical protein